MVLRFANFALEVDLFQLSRRAGVVKLERKVFDTLLYLIERRDRLVSRQELLDNLWAGEHVTDSVLSTSIRALRVARVRPHDYDGLPGAPEPAAQLSANAGTVVSERGDL